MRFHFIQSTILLATGYRGTCTGRGEGHGKGNLKGKFTEINWNGLRTMKKASVHIKRLIIFASFI